MIRKDNRYVEEQHIEIKIWWYELVVKTMIDKETLYFDDRVWAPLDKKVLIGSWSLWAFIDFFLDGERIIIMVLVLEFDSIGSHPNIWDDKEVCPWADSHEIYLQG
jgi:hypothetical protein